MENRYFKYLLPSPKDKDWGLYVTDAGRSHIPPRSVYPPSGHPRDYNFSVQKGRILQSCQLVYITKGSGIFNTEETGRQRIEEGDIFFIFPNVWHCYWPDKETGWSEHWVGFSGEYADRLCQKGLFSPQKPIFKTGDNDLFLQLFESIIDLVRNEPTGYQQQSAAFTFEILANLTALPSGNPSNTSHIQSVIRKAKSLFMERMNETPDMTIVSNSLGVSYSWFRWAFKHYTGFSPHQYLLELRIEKAKFLLRNSSESIKEISQDMGFESPYYFSRLFKSKTGVNPRQWRQKPALQQKEELLEP